MLVYAFSMNILFFMFQHLNGYPSQEMYLAQISSAIFHSWMALFAVYNTNGRIKKPRILFGCVFDFQMGGLTAHPERAWCFCSDDTSSGHRVGKDISLGAEMLEPVPVPKYL